MQLADQFRALGAGMSLSVIYYISALREFLLVYTSHVDHEYPASCHVCDCEHCYT